MKAAELRQAILLAAIQGKIVSQDSSDEPAVELLKRLSAQKMVLAKERRLRKSKRYAELDLDNRPFDIPDSWEWCCLNDLGEFSSGKTPDMTNSLFWENATVPWITSKDMKAKYLTNSALKISLLAQEEMTTYPKGTLLMVVRSGILKRMLPICILTMDSTINQDVKAFSLIDLSMSSYVYYMLKGLEKYILENYTKQVTTVDSLRFSEFSTKMPVPVPPLAEQARIVEKLDELMLLCDALETEEKKLDELETHFTEYLPKAILQAAVQGKLVPQNSHDEPASVLLKRIQQEKAQLVKEGKLKKGKPLPPISEDEIPYDLPEGWVWCRLGEITNVIMGQSPKGDSVSIGEDGMEFHQGKTSFTNKYLTLSIQKANAPTKIATANSVLLSVRAPVGAVNITERDICIGRGLCAFNTLSSMSPLFLFYFLKSMEQSFIEQATGTTFIAVTGEVVKKQLFPLPPFAEQQRIVEKVDELMAFCEKLKTAYTVPIPLDKTDNIIPFPVAKKKEETLMAARGDVSQFSNEAMQAIDDLFAEDEE